MCLKVFQDSMPAKGYKELRYCTVALLCSGLLLNTILFQRCPVNLPLSVCCLSGLLCAVIMLLVAIWLVCRTRPPWNGKFLLT